MLEALTRRRAPHNRIAGVDLVGILAHLAHALRREVGVLIDRHGSVAHVVVSRRWQQLAEMGTAPGGGSLHYVEAHPRPDGRPDDGDRRAIRLLDLDLVATVGTHRGDPTDLWLLEIAPGGPGGDSVDLVVEGPFAVDELAHQELGALVRQAEAARRRAGPVQTQGTGPERAVLVAMAGADGKGGVGDSLEELASLARTAGAEPVARVTQRRQRPDPGRYIGRGKVEEVLRAVEEHAADVVLVDEELTAVQQRTLEGELGVKVLDRTAVVLDIFARRAQTREGRLQVELAQMSYLLPRLSGRGQWLSRLGGGIGTRGPGETKLEVDRRRIRQRIADLQREIDGIQRHRRRQRQPRHEAALPQVAIVGYTNAGKSTLLNRLTGAGAFVEDRLFATLDPMLRRLQLPNKRSVVLADTVGFIQRLPTELVAAFRATLEEVVAADLLLHVVDVSRADWPEQARVVEEVLDSIGAGDLPVLAALNKSDRLVPAARAALAREHPDAVVVSAATGEGLDRLLDAMGRRLPEPWLRVRLRIPYSEGRLIAQLHSEGRVIDRRYTRTGILVDAELPGPLAVRLRHRFGAAGAPRQPRAREATGGGGEARPPFPRR